MQDLLYSQTLAKIGVVKGAGGLSAAEPGQTSDGWSYHTDGLRTVLVFGGNAVSLAEVDFFDWERLVDHYGQQATPPRRRDTRRPVWPKGMAPSQQLPVREVLKIAGGLLLL